MRYVEFGKENRETLVLLHGGGLGWWNYRAASELLKGTYHVVLPLLPGHAGSDGPFTTMAEAARALIDCIDETLGGRVLLLGGLSLGAQIAVEALSQRPDLCACALIESAAVRPDPLTKAMIRPAFGMSYGLVRQRWFARMQFRYLRLPPALFEEYFRDTCAIQRENMIRFLEESSGYRAPAALNRVQARASILLGEKEGRRMLRSGEQLLKLLPRAELTILPGLAHGEFSLKHPDDYVKALIELIDHP